MKSASSYSLITLGLCVSGLGCSDGPAAPVESAAPPDPRAVAVTGILGDPWISDVVDGIADPDLRSPFAQFAGDVESIGLALHRAQDQELTHEDRLAAAILELSLLAVESPPGPETSR